MIKLNTYADIQRKISPNWKYKTTIPEYNKIYKKQQWSKWYKRKIVL